MGTDSCVLIAECGLRVSAGELDHKILVIDTEDPLASRLNTAADLKTVMPGVLENLVEWLKMYKTTDGKAVNVLASDTPLDATAASQVWGCCTRTRVHRRALAPRAHVAATACARASNT